MQIEMFLVDKVKGAIKALYPELRLGKIEVYGCSDEELLSVNKEHLQHDYYTDIITFDYSRGKKISGELFISVDRVRDNAGLLGVDYKLELVRVVAHGILHLIGFKDKTEGQATEMRRREDEVLVYLDKYGS